MIYNWILLFYHDNKISYNIYILWWQYCQLKLISKWLCQLDFSKRNRCNIIINCSYNLVITGTNYKTNLWKHSFNLIMFVNTERMNFNIRSNPGQLSKVSVFSECSPWLCYSPLYLAFVISCTNYIWLWRNRKLMIKHWILDFFLPKIYFSKFYPIIKGRIND